MFEIKKNQDLIREAGGIPPLVRLLSGSDAERKKDATAALDLLAFNKINHDAIREVGGIAPLVRLLSGTDTEIKKDATAALCALSDNTANEDAIREAGGIPPLVQLLQDSDVELRNLAVIALWAIAGDNTTGQWAMEKLNPTPILEDIKNDSSNTTVKEYAQKFIDIFENSKKQELEGIKNAKKIARGLRRKEKEAESASQRFFQAREVEKRRFIYETCSGDCEANYRMAFQDWEREIQKLNEIKTDSDSEPESEPESEPDTSKTCAMM